MTDAVTAAELPPAASVADAVAAFAASAQFADEDPRAALVKVAWRLACVADECPDNVMVTRELRATLEFLAQHPGTPPDAIDELVIRRHARRAASMLAQS